MALTFDDGPDPDLTPRLLDVLGAYSARATFFMCGLAALRHPDVVQAVARAGHSIGGHTWDHRRVRGLRGGELNRQIGDTHTLLEELSGRPVRWFRPPWGDSDRDARAAARRRRAATVRWSADGEDWRYDDAELIADTVLARIRPGAIVLLHDGVANFFSPDAERAGRPANRTSTLLAMDRILASIRERGLDPVALDIVPPAAVPATGRPRRPRRARPGRTSAGPSPTEQEERAS